MDVVSLGLANAFTKKRQEAPPTTGSLLTIPAQGIKPVNFMNWRRAIRRVENGTGAARLLCVGDSTTMGVGASGNNGGVQSYPGQLQALLNGWTAPTSYSFGIPQQSGSNDGRWVTSTPWVFTGQNLAGVGWGARAYYRNDSTGAGNLVYTPGNQADTIVIWYAIGSTNPTSIPVTIDGTAQTGINSTTGTTGIGKATYTVAKGLHTVTLGQPGGATGGGGIIFAVEAYVAAVNEIRVGNVGVGSSTSSDWTNTSIAAGAFNGAAGIKAYAPDLSIIMLGINDARATATSSTLTTNLTTLIAAAKVTGDVILMSVTPADPGQPGYSLEATYQAAVTSLASSNGCGFIDIYARQGSNAANVAKGWAADGIGHLTATGYADVAQAVFDTIRKIT